MIKTLQEKHILNDFFKGEIVYENEVNFNKNLIYTYNLPEVVGKMYKNPHCFTNANMFKNLLKNIDESLYEDVIDLYMFHCFFQENGLHVLDGKNKYATFFLKNKNLDTNDSLYLILQSSFAKAHKYENLVNSKYEIYITSSDSTKEDKRSEIFSIRKIKDYHYQLEILINHEPFHKILKEKYSLKPFKSFLYSQMNIELLGFVIKTFKIFQEKDSEIIENFYNLKSGHICDVGSSVRFNYFWKFLNYEPSEKNALIVAECIDSMKMDGSSYYIKNYEKVCKWSKNNPDYSQYFKNVKAVKDEDNFLFPTTDCVCLHLCLSALQKISKNKKHNILDLISYKNKIHTELVNNMNINLISNYIGTSTNEHINGDKIISVTFNYPDDKENFGLDKNFFKNFYQDIIIDLVDNSYSIDIDKVKIRIEEMILQSTVPYSQGLKNKVSKF